jgi:hypothetical protein
MDVTVHLSRARRENVLRLARFLQIPELPYDDLVRYMMLALSDTPQTGWEWR